MRVVSHGVNTPGRVNTPETVPHIVLASVAHLVESDGGNKACDTDRFVEDDFTDLLQHLADSQHPRWRAPDRDVKDEDEDADAEEDPDDKVQQSSTAPAVPPHSPFGYVISAEIAAIASLGLIELSDNGPTYDIFPTVPGQQNTSTHLAQPPHTNSLVTDDSFSWPRDQLHVSYPSLSDGVEGAGSQPSFNLEAFSFTDPKVDELIFE